MWRRLITATILAVLVGGATAAAATRVVRLATPAEDGSLTPYTFANDYPLLTLVYDTLTWRDSQGFPRPWLASSVRRDAGGLHVTVRLRSGERWQDGRPLTSADVKFTFAYIAAHPHARFTPELRDIQTVSAPDPRTVVFTLRHPALGFSDQPLADVPILPEHLWAGLAAGARVPPGLPVGSGPYRLVQHVPGRLYVFAANQHYFRGAPTVSRIEARIVPDPQARLHGLSAPRTLDMIPLALEGGKSFLPLPAGIHVDRSTPFDGTMLIFNVAAPPFDSAAARRTVAQSLNLDAIAGVAGGPSGVTPAGQGLVHPASRWAQQAVLYRQDLPAARRGFASGALTAFPVLASANSPVVGEAARRVALAIDQAGGSARVDLQPAAAVAAALNSGSFAAAVVPLPALVSYDPSYLAALFGSGVMNVNFGRYHSSLFAQLDGRVEAARDQPARRAAVAAELRLLARDLPAVPLFFGATTFAFSPAAFDGWVDVRGTGILDKQSFLPHAAVASADRPAVANPLAKSAGTSISLIPVIVALAVIGGLVIGWSTRRRRPRS